jgi:pyrroline-5-carboxylate reductase
MSVAVIGAGTLGRAVLKALIARKDGEPLYATRRNRLGLQDLEAEGVAVGSDNVDAARHAETIIVVVKPSDVPTVLRDMSEAVAGKLVISLAAAVPMSFLRKAAQQAHFVRAMPNVAAVVRSSFTPFCVAPEVTPEQRARAVRYLEAFGTAVEVEERHMDAMTALSGSGPAYVFTVVEALMYAGIKVGLPRELALHASLETLVGASKLALESRRHPAELRDMVVTPGGIAIEGIYELEETALRTALMRAIEKATAKGALITEKIGKEHGMT